MFYIIIKGDAMKQLHVLVLTVSGLYSGATFATSMVEVMGAIGSVVCGEKSVCNQNVSVSKAPGGGLLNAIAVSRFKVDSSKVEVTEDFGNITEDTKKMLNISAKDGGVFYYTFTPKNGKKTFVAVESNVPGKGKLGHGQIFVTMYAQKAGDKTTEWTWKASYPIDLSKVTPEDNKVMEEFTITAAGTFEDPFGSRIVIAS
jgi:hypothetical protein